MPKSFFEQWREENTNMFIDGYFAQRIASGNFPDNCEPRSPLPAVPVGVSMIVQNGFLFALRAEAQKKLQKE